jgi:hypothetical protein
MASPPTWTWCWSSFNCYRNPLTGKTGGDAQPMPLRCPRFIFRYDLGLGVSLAREGTQRNRVIGNCTFFLWYHFFFLLLFC